MTAAAKKVLIVEDDSEIRDSLGMMLALEGFEVMTARHGLHALDVLRTADPLPKVILLDLMMPIMDGPSFLSALEKDSRCSAIPVITFSAVVTGAPDSPLVRCHLPKPLDDDKLLREVARYLRG